MPTVAGLGDEVQFLRAGADDRVPPIELAWLIVVLDGVDILDVVDILDGVDILDWVFNA